MKQIKSKSRKIIIVTVLVPFVFFAFFFEVAFFKTLVVCGRVTGVSEGKRGSRSLEYTFENNEGVFLGDIPLFEIDSNITIDSLKKVECIKIEYSFMSKTINRFADERFLKK